MRNGVLGLAGDSYCGFAALRRFDSAGGFQLQETIMKRRTFILGTSAAASGAAILGSGAYSSVAAERDVTVEVAGDKDAYLGLHPTSEYAVLDNGTLALDLSPSNPTEHGGQGVNANAKTIIKNVFEITNQGTQPVEVLFDTKLSFPLPLTLLLSPQDPNYLDDIDIFAWVIPEPLVKKPDPIFPRFAPPIFDEPSWVLDPGESVSYLLSIGVPGEPGDRLEQRMTLVAEAVNPSTTLDELPDSEAIVEAAVGESR